MDAEERIRPLAGYDFHGCVACGECLAACPYVPLSRGRARREMQRLRRGAPSVILKRCGGCATCNAACKRGCRPYSLIRRRWHERFEREALPLRARFLLPHSEPNFRSRITLSPKEDAYVRGLRKAPTQPRVLYTGCNALLLPYQLQSSLWLGLEVFGSLDFCCGEMYYRMGLFDQARQCALRLQKLLQGSPVREMVFLCSACYNMLANVYPNELGVDLDFEKTFATDFLKGRLDSGDLEFTDPLNRRVTVHDSCHAKLMGGALWDPVRELLIRAGADIVESEHTRETSLCCGVAAGCSRFSPVDLITAGIRRLVEFDRSGAQCATAYCNGCFLTLETVRRAVPTRTPVEPTWDLLMRAAGETVPGQVPRRRTRQMLLGVMTRAMPDALRVLKRFCPCEIHPIEDLP